MVHELRPIAFPTAIVLALTLPKNIFVQSVCEGGFVTSQMGVSHSSSAVRRELGRNCSSVPLAATPGAGLEREQDLPWVSSAGSWWGTGKRHGRRMCIRHFWVVLRWFLHRFLHLSFGFPLGSVCLWQEMWTVKRLVRQMHEDEL